MRTLLDEPEDGAGVQVPGRWHCEYAKPVHRLGGHV